LAANSSAAVPPTKSILIIGSGELLNRLPEALSCEQIFVDLFDVKNSVLAKSAFVRHHLVLDHGKNEPLHKAVFRNRKKLSNLDYDYFLFADDLIAIELARKSKDVEMQLKLLPVRRAEGIRLVGSKVGFVNVAHVAKIKIPRSLVARNPNELVELSRSFNSKYLVKADVGGGGSTVRRFKEPVNFSQAKELKSWFPVVVQEEIEGTLISVEGFYDSGKLLGWVYSKFDVESWEFGPSTRRTYFDPPGFDFEQTLMEFGSASGFHGFMNATFIWNEEEKFHYLFEADNRANGWHQFANRFGVHWGNLFANSERIIDPVRQKLPQQQVTFSLFPREPLFGIYIGKWKPALRWLWLWPRPGTWEARNNLDKAVNRAELLEIKVAISNRLRLRLVKPFRFVKLVPRRLHLLLAKMFVWGWQSLNENTRARLESAGLKKLLVFIFRV
jgi:hypothetical protein